MTQETIALPPTASLTLSTDQVHRVVVTGARFVNLLLLDVQWAPLEDTLCVLHIESRAIYSRTSSQGQARFKIPRALADGVGLVEVESTTLGWSLGRGVVLAQVDGADTPKGQRLRLDNLGYLAVGSDVSEDTQSASIWAIEEFQCDHHLVVDGVCGPQTQAKLVEVHGH